MIGYALHTKRILMRALWGAPILAGCAVLTVDVDVYKGPLANEQAVLLEQTAVTVMGAKPILIEARDRLENAYRVDNTGEAGAAGLEAQVGDDHEYKPAHMPERYFLASKAWQLNEVLSLYKDRVEWSIPAQKAETGFLANWKTFERAYGDFVPAKDDPLHNVESQNKLFGPQSNAKFHALRKLTLENWLEGSSSSRNLKDLQAIVRELQTLQGTEQAVSHALDGNTLERLNPSGFYALLADPRVAELYAKLLVSPSDPSKKHSSSDASNQKLIGEKIEALGRSYRPMMLAFSQALEYALQFIIVADYSDEDEANRSKQYAEIVQRFVRTWFLFEGLRFAEVGGFSSAMPGAVVNTDALISETEGLLSHDYNLAKDTPTKMRDKLRLAFERNPSAAATELLSLHRALIGISSRLDPDDPNTIRLTTDAQRNVLKELKVANTKAGLEFGLAWEPVRALDDKEDPASLKAITDAASRVVDSSTGLGGGRQKKGIERLIEDYITALDQVNSDCEPTPDLEWKLSGARAELMNALIRFATKTQLIANYSLFDKLGSSQLKSKNELTLLEAVGNSLLAQLNDLNRQGNWDRRTQGLKDAERTAILSSFGALAGPVLDGFVADLRKAAKIRTNIEQSKKEVLDLASCLGKWLNPIDPAVAPFDRKKRQTGIEAYKDLLAHLESQLAGALKADPVVSSNVEEVEALIKKSTAKDIVKVFRGVAPAGAQLPASDIWAKWVEILDTRLIAIHRSDSGSGSDILKSAADMIETAVKGVDRGDSAAKALEEVRKKLPATSPENLAALKVANDKIQEMRSNLPTTPALSTHAKRPQELIDEVVSFLSHELVQAVRIHGEGSSKVQGIRASLRALYQHRSGFTYLRPAVSFLRSSAPTSKLGDGQGKKLGWENMLLDHQLSQLPFLGRDLKTPIDSKQNTIESLDRQYWQNINHVRVAGSGTTNKVLAKDDIGNWYLKSYSGDVGPVIESAQNLASFSLGGAMNIDLLSDANSIASNDPAEPDGEEGPEGSDAPAEPSEGSSAPKEDSSLLEKQAKAFGEQLIEVRLKDLRSLGQLASGVGATLDKRWDNRYTTPNAAPINTALDIVWTNSDSIQKVIAFKDIKIEEVLETYRSDVAAGKPWSNAETYDSVQAYRTVQVFYRSFKLSIENGSVAPLPAAANYVSRVNDLKKDLDDVVGIPLRTLLNERISVLDAEEGASDILKGTFVD